MNKIKSQIESRKEFIKLSIDDPKEAAKQIADKAHELSKSTKASESIKIISDLLYLSHMTIYRDCAKNT